MKKLLILSVLCLLSWTTHQAQAQSQCNYPCPQFPTQPVIENFNPCNGNITFTLFKLVAGSDRLCSGETFTYTLRNSSGSILSSHTSTQGSVYFNLGNLCTGNYSVCVQLNSTQRDCPEYCMTFYFVNNGDNCCEVGVE